MEAATRENAVTPAESKTIEGQRLTALFGGVAALPAAALVAKGSEGAPLFMVAISCVVAAYMFWMFTDDVYETSIHIRPGEPEFPALARLGYGYQWSCFAYGALSVTCTLLGFAGVHSKLRGPLSVEAGFVVAFLIALTTVGHVAWAMHARNGLMTMMQTFQARKKSDAASTT